MDIKNNREFGSSGEKVAVEYLEKNGYQIIARNFRVGRSGEIDIIARETGYICFIEVKTRSSILYGTPSESVNIRKQQQIIKLARIYINRHRLHECNIRFDVVEVLIRNRNNPKEVQDINLIKNAF